jgi:hypothetical protein
MFRRSECDGLMILRLAILQFDISARIMLIDSKEAKQRF